MNRYSLCVNVILSALVAAVSVSAETCVKPVVDSKVYVSSETVLTPEIVIVAEFTVACSNKPQNLNFHAEFEGELFPVTRSIDSHSYQFTINRKPKALSVGAHKVNVYDESAVAQLRKMQSAGTKDEVKPTFALDVDYQGPSRGLIIPSEFLALGGGITFSLLAFHTRGLISN